MTEQDKVTLEKVLLVLASARLNFPANSEVKITTLGDNPLAGCIVDAVTLERLMKQIDRT